MQESAITRWLKQTDGFRFTLYAVTAAFCTYFCMYAFRKPFAVGMYEDLSLWGIDYKIVLIITQVLGYTLSKFIGIRVIAEMPPGKRIFFLLLFIGIAHLALLLFGWVPYPYNFIFLFFNGLPLGMVYGLVFSFLEGRRFTEMLGAGLSASFIVSSGVVKSVGKWSMDSWGVDEFWMPFVTGAVFVPPLLLSVAMLRQIPPPDAQDIALRTERVPMSRKDRLNYLKTFALGLFLLIVLHMMLTAYRDFRDNFAIEILTAIDYGDAAANLAKSEIPIAFAILVVLGSLMFIRNNRLAVGVVHSLILVGVIMAGVSTAAFEAGMMDPYLWFILVGMGMYLAYVPYHSMLLDRLIAFFQQKGNAGYLIYIADATGYLGSVLVLLYKNFGAANISWLNFFINISYVMAFAGGTCIIGAYVYFFIKNRVWVKNGRIKAQGELSAPASPQVA